MFKEEKYYKADLYAGIDLFVSIDNEAFGDLSDFEYNVDQEGKGTVRITRVLMDKTLSLKYGVMHCFYADEFGGHAHMSLYLDKLINEQFKSSIEIPYPEVVQTYECRIQMPYREISKGENAELRYPMLTKKQKKKMKKPKKRIGKTFEKHLRSAVFDWLTFNANNHDSFENIIDAMKGIVFHDISDEPQKRICAALESNPFISKDRAEKIYSIACRNTEEELKER